MRKLARWSFSHRKTVLAAWLIAVVGLTVIHSAAGSAYRDSFKLSGTESSEALELLEQSSPQTSGDVDHIVVAVEEGGSIREPAVKSDIAAMLEKVEGLPHVGSIASPYAPGSRT